MRLDDLDYELLDFGEKVYNEVSGLGSGFDEVGDMVRQLHAANPRAALPDWVTLFCDKFESLEDINDLNGALFDVKMVQLICLHFCDGLVAEPADVAVEAERGVRDLVGLAAIEGFDFVQEEIQSESVSSLESSQQDKVSLVAPSLTSPSSAKVAEVAVSQEVTENKEQISEKLAVVIQNIEGGRDQMVVQEVIETLAVAKITEAAVVVTELETVAVVSDLEKMAVVSELETIAVVSELEKMAVEQDLPIPVPVPVMLEREEINGVLEMEKAAGEEISVAELENANENIAKIAASLQQVEQIALQLQEPNRETATPEARPVGVGGGEMLAIAASVEGVVKRRSTENEQVGRNKDRRSTSPPARKSPEPSKGTMLLSRTSTPPPPVDPDEDFCDLYLGISMRTEPNECLVLVCSGDVTANATVTTSSLYMNGRRVAPDADLTRLLPNGDDFVLVYIPNLKKDGEEDASVSELAVPLSAWEDGRTFVLGFVLYLEPEDKCCVAFVQGDNSLHLALVPRNRIKKFESVTSFERLEPGLEVRLMVKPRNRRRGGVVDKWVRYRATLCIPDQENTCYDLVDTTHWAAKTRAHLSDEETLRDLEDGCCSGGTGVGRRVSVRRVTEGARSLLLLRAENRKLCVDMYNKIMETKHIFEQLPGEFS